MTPGQMLTKPDPRHSGAITNTPSTPSDTDTDIDIAMKIQIHRYACAAHYRHFGDFCLTLNHIIADRKTQKLA